MYPTPILHIEVEGVKHSLVQSLQSSHDEFCRIVEEEIASVDIESLIRNQIRLAIPGMIQDVVTRSVEKIGRGVIEEARWSEAMGEIVRAAIDEAARNVFNARSTKE